MSKKYGAPPPLSGLQIRQDMINLLLQSCHLKPSRAIEFARELVVWVFKPEDPKERSLRWWACKCALNATNSPGIQAYHTIQSAIAFLAFIAEETQDDYYGFEIEAEKDEEDAA